MALAALIAMPDHSNAQHKATTAAPPFERTEQRKPCADYDPLRRPHFGDLHVHTALSFDASTQDTRNRPIDAYRFAMGAPMGIQPYDENDQPTRTVQLDRPLQFAAVTDHAEFLGEVRICTTPGLDGHWHPVCLVHRYLPRWSFMTFGAAGLSYKHRWGLCGKEGEICLNHAEGRVGRRSRPMPRRPTIAARTANSPVSSAMNGRRVPRPDKTCTTM